MAAIRETVAAAQEGTGRALLVEGAAGVGKSALLEHATGTGLRVLRAVGGEWERDVAFGAVRQLIGRLEPARFSQAAAPAASIVAPAAGPVEPGFVTLNALYWLVATLAEEEPLLLVVDDLHWVDDASLLALDHLARRLHDIPVSLIGALRPSEPGGHEALLDGLRQQPAVTLITPQPLTARAVEDVVRARMPDADDAMCTAYYRASAGNPLYLQELIRLRPANAEAVAAAAIPSIGERIVRRVRRAAPAASALAGAAAVLGDQTALPLAIELAGLDPSSGRDAADELVKLGVLARPDPPAFAHPVIRHSLYAQMPYERRTALHAAAANRLEDVDAVAGHLMALAPAGSDAVAARLREAAADARARGATATAARRLQRALDEGAATPTRPRMLLELGQAQAVERDPAALATLREAFVLSDGPLRTEVAGALTEVLSMVGLWEEMWEVLDAVRPAPDDPSLVALEAVRAVALANDAAGTATFVREWNRLERLTHADHWAAGAIAALLAAQSVAYSRPPAAAEPLIVRATDGAPDYQDKAPWAITQLLMTLLAMGATDRFDRLLGELRVTARQGRSFWETCNVLLFDAMRLAEGGDLVAAEAVATTLFRLAEESGAAMLLTSTGHLLSDVIMERPGMAAFRQALLATQVPPAFADTQSGAFLHEARAQVLLADGDRNGALAEMRAAQGVYIRLRLGPARSSWRSLLASLVDDDAERRTLLDEELALARAGENARATGIALRRRGDEASLEEALTVLAAASAPLELARARADLGALRSDPELLQTALAEAERCGAERLREHVASNLRAAGIDSPRRSTTLTPAEVRVARLAAEGQTNLGIAQELFVSVKTVEAQLTSAYAKLGLSGRGARARLADALPR